MSKDPTAIPACGVGILCNSALRDMLKADAGLVDYLSITPDIFWTDHGPNAAQRFAELDPWIDFLEWAAARMPVVAHSIGLSLGSAAFSDSGYVAHLLSWHRRYKFLWHSDHLSFARVQTASGSERNAGMAAPLPCDQDGLDMVAFRTRELVQSFPTAFLVENGVSYLDFPEQDMTECEFLNRLVDTTQCGLLLDLHNLHTNARNHGFDAVEYLRNLNLDAVLEVHIAGGSEFAGMYTDSHAGPCAPAVWDLLDEVVPRARNLKGITYEFHESYFPLLGAAGVRKEIEHARAIWARHH